MIDIRTILCPIDFSDHSRRALQYAAALARAHKSTLVVLHVNAAGAGLQLSDSPILGTPTRDLTAEASRFIQMAETAGVPVEVVIRKGTVAEEILKQAIGSDLLAMGTHGRSGFDRLILGSITEKVLRKAVCPVLVVPRGSPDSVPAAPVTFERILCPIDFSYCSLHALNYALLLTRSAAARLTVLHVMVYSMEDEAPEMYETLVSDSRLGLADLHRRFEDYSRERLASAVADAVGTPSTVETQLAVGKPYREILRIAGKQQADLIVMGVHGRGPADLTFFGSTTYHVVRQARCPVLTVRKG
jgi:nucleotide-binding universal stress UspA family protein